MSISKQFTVRGASSELIGHIRALSTARGESMNATILRTLEDALGVKSRRIRLQRYATWTEKDKEEFDRVFEAQRTINEELWR